MSKQISQTKTVVIDNFSGKLTRYKNGEMNSGLAKYSSTFGIDNFSKPRNLTWMENPVQIDPNGTVITDLIVAGQVRVENSVTYLYAIGHLARFYKIQVNNIGTKNPQYDNPVLLATLANSQTFTYGASMTFYGPTEKVYIGCDQGVTSINFDGTTETVVGVASSTQWITSVPRQVVQFLGKLYYTNNTNIAEIDSTLTVTSYNKLSPGFPPDYIARDIRTSADGRYLIIVVTRTPLFAVISVTQDTNEISNSDSKIIYWDGIATGASSFTSLPSFAQTAYFTFSNFEYAFGYDNSGANVSTPTSKVLTLQNNDSPLPNAITSNGNLLEWWTNGYDNGFQKANYYVFGSLDEEVGIGFYRQAKMTATSPATDVVRVPFTTFVTNSSYGLSTAGYSSNIIGLGRMYFSTLEYNGTNTYYRFYYFTNVPLGTGTAMSGVYETQTQLFSKKIKATEYRLYIEPLVTNNSFKIDLIGVDGLVMTGTTQTFTVGANGVSAGADAVQYNPKMNATYAIGVRVTNLGTANFTCHKVEVDYEPTFGTS